MAYLRPSSRKNLKLQIRAFLSFCTYFSLHDDALSPELLCAYIEFLLNSYPCPGTVKNFISGLSTFQTWRGLPTAVFHSFKVKQMWRAINLTVRYVPSSIHIITARELNSLLISAAVLGSNALIFRALISLLFFSMLRISSCLPPTLTTFDSTRHLNLDDILFTEFGMLIHLKWAKNLQNADSAIKVPIVKNKNEFLCPVFNIKNYLVSLCFRQPHQPLFLVGSGATPLDINTANRWLRLVVCNSPLAGRRVTFYSLRKGSCSAAFKLGAPLADIKIFGAWKSESVLNYLNANPARVRVAETLSKLY